MAFEETYQYRVWDHEKCEWWTFKPNGSSGKRSVWMTKGKASVSLSAKYGKGKWEDRFTIIKCKLVPVEEETMLARFKQL